MTHIDNENNKTSSSNLTNKIKDILQKNFIETFGINEYTNWLQDLQISTENSVDYIATTSSPLIYKKIISKYKKFIEYIFKSNGYNITILIKKEKAPTSNTKKEGNTAPIFNSIFNNNFRFSHFIKGESNEFAYHSAKTLAHNIINQKSIQNLNPLYICGPVGLGKTHLLHAIAHEIHDNNKKIKILYISAEKFMHEFIKSLRNKNISSFKEHLRNIDVLLFDDIQFLSNKTQTLSELEQTLDALTSLNKTIVLTADRAPKDLEINNRMKSRLLGGLVADIGHSNYDLRLSILKSKIHQLKININIEILEYLANNITSNIRELEGALHKIIEYDKMLEHNITITQVKNILQKSIQSNKNISIESIVSQIAKYYKTTKADIISENRTRKITRIRQIAMHLCRICTGESLTNIGNYFSGRGHTAVIHASNNITKIMLTDHNINTDFNNLKQTIDL